MKRRLKFRYWILIGCAVLVAVVAAGATVLLETEAGLHWAVARVESFSGGTVTIGSAHGHLAGPFRLKGLRVATGTMTIEAHEVDIDWHPWALVAGRLDVASLLGRNVRVTVHGARESTSPALPDRLSLPLRLIVERARLENLTLDMSGHATHLDHLALALDASDETIRLDKLEARGTGIALGGRLHARPYGRWPVQADIALLLRPPGYPTVGGRTRLDGNLRGTLQLDQRLQTPFRAELRADISHLFGAPAVHGTLHVEGLDPHALDGVWPQLEAGADLAFEGDTKNLSTHGTLTLHPPNQPTRTLNLDFAGGFDKGEIHMARLDLALAGTPMRLAARGTVTTDAPHALDLTLAWRNLHWPLQGAPLATAAAGGAHLTGTLRQWRLGVRTLLQPRDLPQGRWALSARGDNQSVTLDALAGRWLGGTLAGHGQLQLGAGHPFRFTARVNGLQAQAVTPDLQGHVNFDLDARGELGPFQARARIAGLGGRLQGQAIKGKADASYAGGVFTLHALTLAAGPNRVEASGRWGEKIDLAWRVQAPQLEALGHGLGGRLDAHGSIQGAPATPRLKAALNAGKLRWRDLSIAQVQGQATIDFDPRSASALELHVTRLERGNIQLDKLDALLEGPREEQHFLLSIEGSEGDVKLAGTGRLDQSRWSGQLTTGYLHPARGPAFNLAAPAEVTAGRKQLQLGESCWQGQGRSRFCLAAAAGSEGWKTHVVLRQMPLDIANPYLGGELALQGALNGRLSASGGQGALQAIAEIHAGHGSMTRSFGGQSEHLTFDEAGFEARTDGGLLKARLGVILADGGLFDAAAEVPWESHPRLAGTLRLRARIPDLSGLGALSSAVTDVSGQLSANLTATGSLANPRFKGDVRLRDAGLTLTRFGTRIRNSSLTLQGAGTGLAIDGQLADAGRGSLEVHGVLRHRGGQWALKGHVQGTRFRVANMPEAEVSVSPDLDIDAQGYAVTLNGSVAVPYAKIKPPHFSNAIAPTPDLVVVGGENRSRNPWRLTARLHIRLGDDVHFDGYGLTARIGGELSINDTPGKLTTASGELKILDGQYKAYGQDLTIQHGRLLFSGGPIANPGLDIRAARTVGMVTAGLLVTGTLRSPRLQVFSDPPMSQSDALAYMLFGHGMQQSSDSQQSTVNRAANAIGIAGGTFLVKSLGKRVGLDTVSVENANPYSTSANQASLFLGKYLSPRLYVSYGIGLYAPINLLRVRYTLSRHWALEAESGTFSGADILFNIEH